jgi:hypothetical protein
MMVGVVLDSSTSTDSRDQSIPEQTHFFIVMRSAWIILPILAQSALKLNFACSQKHPIFGCCARLRQPDRFYAARSEIFPIGDREPTGTSPLMCTRTALRLNTAKPVVTSRI